MVFLSGSESVEVSYHLFFYVLSLKIQLSRGEGSDSINRLNSPTCLFLFQEEFEDTKGVIRIRISKKNIQHGYPMP